MALQRHIERPTRTVERATRSHNLAPPYVDSFHGRFQVPTSTSSLLFTNSDTNAFAGVIKSFHALRGRQSTVANKVYYIFRHLSDHRLVNSAQRILF